MSLAQTPSRLWWTAEEIAGAALPDMPASRQGVEAMMKRLDWRGNPELARRRDGKGGGWEYSWQLFPMRAQRKLLSAAAPAAVQPEPLSRDEVWAWFEALPEVVKDKARARLAVLQQVEALEGLPSMGRHNAICAVARQCHIGTRTIWGWFALIEGIRPDDRLARLAPRNRARVEPVKTSEIDPEFFEVLKADYLRLGGPPFADSYRRAVRVARSKGWETVPERTARRAMDRRVSELTQVLARKGVEALKRHFPSQVRDKTSMHALEAVNADFHKFDVFVAWPSPAGLEPQILRPQMVAFQDIYSGRILSWRVDVAPNATAVQLAAGDMIEEWGIPDHIVLDNGREFAAKAITGGAATRYRFKVKEDDVPGLFVSLGCQIHWASPYHGQAKPIERAFRDMARSIALDPRFDGAYTGNKPDAKPENYGSRAVSLETFLTVLAEGIEEHNTRIGRRSEVAFGRSFAEVFEESYRTAPIRKATAAQRRLWLLGAEGLRSDRKTGAVWFKENEFWADWMHAHAGARLIVRFDPANFWDGLHVYALDGRYLGHAPVRQRVGFFDMEEARTLARARSAWLQAERAALKAQRRLTAAELGGFLDAAAPVPPEAPIEAKVVKPVFGKATARAMPPAEAPAIAEAQATLIADFAARRAASQPQPSPEEESSREMFRRALEIERRMAAGEAVTPAQREWLSSVQTTSAYRGERMLWEEMGDAIFG